MFEPINAAPLFATPSPARTAADAAILRAAGGSGFITLHAPNLPTDPATRASLLRVFALPEPEKRRLWRQRYAPAHPNIYRGFSPLQPASGAHTEGFDVGPDIAHRHPTATDDPLLEPSPLPPEHLLPTWHTEAAAYFRAMENLGQHIMRALARALTLPETFFDATFAGGNSTLRFLHAPFDPATPPERQVEHAGQPRPQLTGGHIDSGFVTLLVQDGTPGLQAEAQNATWHDVPCTPGTIAINFGGLLERWTAGAVRATRHRVLSPGRARFSVPFFYEPAVTAEIRPLPLPNAAQFPPFTYGDHLWSSMMKFPTFKNMDHLRPPRGTRHAA